jgi:hypothetical protein
LSWQDGVIRFGKTSAEAPFTLPPDAPKGTVAIMCERSSIVPDRFDYKVLASGFALIISNLDRTAALELAGGQIRFRMINGTLAATEMAAVQARLDSFQVSGNKRP